MLSGERITRVYQSLRRSERLAAGAWAQEGVGSPSRYILQACQSSRCWHCCATFPRSGRCIVMQTQIHLVFLLLFCKFDTVWKQNIFRMAFCPYKIICLFKQTWCFQQWHFLATSLSWGFWPHNCVWWPSLKDSFMLLLQQNLHC